jgi:hypothetical protein
VIRECRDQKDREHHKEVITEVDKCKEETTDHKTTYTEETTNYKTINTEETTDLKKTNTEEVDRKTGIPIRSMVNSYRVVIGRGIVVSRVEVEVDGVVDPVKVAVELVEVVASRVATVVIAQHLIDKNGHTNIKHLTDTKTNIYHYQTISTHITFSTY